jgi:hypothetical protein
MSAKFRPFSDLDIPTTRRRNLPHWEVSGATYFLTFRLADSMPAGVVKELEWKSCAWLQLHGLTDRREIWGVSAAAQKEYRTLISAEEERCSIPEKAAARYGIRSAANASSKRCTMPTVIAMRWMNTSSCRTTYIFWFFLPNAGR